MKLENLLLLGAGGYLLYTLLTNSPNTAAAFGGGSPAVTPPPTPTPTNIPNTSILSGGTITGTTIPVSAGFAAKAAGLTMDQVKAPLGVISVTQAPKNAAGQTAWDQRIRSNFAASGKAYPY